jgi:type VI secretion system protein VasG
LKFRYGNEFVVQINLKQLVGKLNSYGRRSLEAAAGLCLSRTNYNVEIEHWLMRLIDEPNTDVAAILQHFDVNTSRLAADLTRAIDRIKTGSSRSPAMSPDLIELIRAGWLIGSIDYQSSSTRTGHLICALLSDPSLARTASSASREFDRISPEKLREEFTAIVQISVEEAESAAAAASATEPAAAGGAPMTAGKTPALDQFTIDLTARARTGEIDPVIGRSSEIRQIIDILTRRRQNNPILTGEAGVGKTAVVEGFALRLATGDVPPSLHNVSVRTLDLGLLQAGAGMRGEFENRLKSVINEVKASPTPIVLFVDEAHTLIGAGGGGGQSDAANLLKPALARGELRTVAATTWAEYKKYFEKDAALARRFQVVKVDEPVESTAIDMMLGLTETLESHHGVRILDEAVVDAVKLSSRYISGRQLPDKSVSLLDTTCARIGLSQSSTPPPLEDCQREIESLKVAIAMLEREEATGLEHDERLGQLRDQLEEATNNLDQLQQRWEQEKELVANIHHLYQQLAGNQEDEDSGGSEIAEGNSEEGDPPKTETPLPEEEAAPGQAEAVPPPLSAEELKELQHKLSETNEQLRLLQGETPLVHPVVNSQAIAETVASWTGIPVGRMVADEIKTILNLKQMMEESIVGQSHALSRIAESIRTSRANMSDPKTPIGVFLMVGTSGVGKTETAVTLAELLYGGEQNMTVINMSEFKEEHKVSLLMGSPPGYVGYGEGGVLTEAVRRKPYSVVLLDEMEKAHPGVQDVFYQVFDKGTMKDGEGRDIDFKNTVIIMTTNAASDFIKNLCADPDTTPDPDGFVEAVFPELLKSFKPAFLGRLSIVPFYPLSDEVMRMIIGLKLNKIRGRVGENYKAEFSYSPELVDVIAQRCTEVDTGARNIDHILNRTLLPELSAEFLSRMAEGGAIKSVQVAIGEDGNFSYHLS